MKKEWHFTVKGHRIRVTNSWLWGTKLYVDGDCRDRDHSFWASGKTAQLSTKLGEHGVLEIYPLSTLLSVEMDAVLVRDAKHQKVFSSHQRLSLTERRRAPVTSHLF